MSEHDRDDADLRARMRDADPAAALPPVDGDRVARLLEDAMSDTTTETRQTGTRRRSALTWLVAAAAAVVILGVAAATLLERGEDAAPTAGPGQGAGTEPTVTRLTMPTQGAGRCMVPNADTLSTAAYALDGEVSSIEGGVVTLEVGHWYAGGPTDRVEVDQASVDRSALILAPRFEDGERYLVAGGDDGDVMVCGFSAPYSPRLAAVYDRAFGS